MILLGRFACQAFLSHTQKRPITLIIVSKKTHMSSSTLILIVAAELVLLLLVICIVLGIQNRGLRKLVNQLTAKAKALMQELKKARAAAQDQPPSPNTKQGVLGYLDYLEQQIACTLDHHAKLKSNQDIALDIIPGTPLPYRTVALRHALLLAEKESCASIANAEEPDWKVLRGKYEQIFSFLEDYADEATDDDAADSEELNTIRAELDNARQRIKNLEKFKQLYFDLEEQWKSTKQEAENQYQDLSSMASKLDDSGELSEALSKYHNSYDGIASMIENGVDGQDIAATAGSSHDSSKEVRQLRAVAADQHRIIEELQRQLREASTDAERTQIVEGLQGELQKQMRFVQESETCIQLLEDELTSANRDIESLKARVKDLPGLKSELLDMRKHYDELDLKYHSLVTENRKLQKQLDGKVARPVRETKDESGELRKQLSEMESRYNELEEKFLDMKLNQ